MRGGSGVCVGVGLGVAVCVIVEVCVAVEVSAGDCVAVGVELGEASTVWVALAFGVAVAVAGDDVDVLERVRALQVLGAQLHHHAVLVERMVDGRHQPLAEGVVQHRIHLLRGHAQARRRIAVDDHACPRDLAVLDRVTKENVAEYGKNWEKWLRK